VCGYELKERRSNQTLWPTDQRINRSTYVGLLPRLLPIENLKGILGRAWDILVDHERAAFLPPSIMLGDELSDNGRVLCGDVGGLAIIGAEIE
jgi:hypothetical protein